MDDKQVPSNLPFIICFLFIAFIVCLGAYLLGVNNRASELHPIAVIPTPAPVYHPYVYPTYSYPTPTPDYTPVAWSIYQNSTYGFVIGYPSNWEVTQGSDTLVNFYNGYRSGGIGGVWVTIFINSLAEYPQSEPTFKEYYASKPGPITTTPDKTAVKIANVTVDGNNAVKYTEFSDQNNVISYYINYSFIKGPNHYTVSFSTGSKELEEKNLTTYDTMISSLHFTTASLD